MSQAPSFAGSWSKLNPSITPWILDAVHDTFHFTGLTPVQASVIPLAIAKNKDLLVEAVTGSGKTLAYIVPILERLIRREQELKDERGGERGLRKNEVFAIVVAPTRELAIQIHAVLEQFFDALNRKMAAEEALEVTIDDAMPPSSEQESELAVKATYYPSPLLLVSGPTVSKTISPSPIIIATPGRLAAYLSSSTALRSSAATSTIPSFAKNRHQVSLSQFGVLVLDEADQLLSSRDHLKDMRTIWGCLPRQRRNWLFSATMMDIMGEKASSAGEGSPNLGLLLGGESGLEQAGLRNLTRVVVRVQQKDAIGLKRKRENDDGVEEAAGKMSKERRTPVGLQMGYLVCKQSEKMLQFLRTMQRESQVEGKAKFIVYLSTCAAVEYFYRVLVKLPKFAAFRFFSLHGQLPTNVRSKTLQAFSENVSTSSHPAVLLCTDVAARGLDLPEVDVVIQYDPPSDPKMFTHRAGRTARMGRSGTAIVLLGEGREESYVEFLELRKVHLNPLGRIRADLSQSTDDFDVSYPETSAAGSQPRPIDPDALLLLGEWQSILLTDRELSDKAAKAFVSAVRAYSKHEASYIFPLKSLDLFGMGRSYGLLRLPRMPEVTEWRARVTKREELLRSGRRRVADGDDELEILGDGMPWEDRDVDWDTYAYASKVREADRLVALAKTASLSVESQAKRAEQAKRKELKELQQIPWSKKKEKKDIKEVRVEKRNRKRDWEARQVAEAKEKDLNGKKAAEEMEGGQEEYKMMLAEREAELKAEREAAAQAGGFDDLE